MPIAIPQRDANHIFDNVVLFNIKVFGLVLGSLTGFCLFVATNWLVLKGGNLSPEGTYVVGPHLQLLSQYLIGYRVSFLGSIIGMFYGFAFGTLCGSCIGWIYNKIVGLRN